MTGEAREARAAAGNRTTPGRQPGDRALLINRDEIRLQLGLVALRRDDPAAARRYFEAARESVRALPAEYAATPEFRQLLGQAEANLRRLDVPGPR